MVAGDDQTTEFDCRECYNSCKIDLETARKRKEITKLHRPEGVYEVLVCERCGGLFEPAIKEINDE